MAEPEGYAYITGGASGIGKALVHMLVKHNIRVFIADRDIAGAEAVVAELNKSEKVATCAHVDVVNWNSQAKAFSQAVADFGRIDYVYPIAGIGERAWIPNDPGRSGFEMPDLSVIDVDLTGVLYTVGLAVQQFRKQEPGKHGFRGKIGCVASICGIYCVPTIPIYTAAKHAITGFVRSYGKYLPQEKITLNSVNPNVVRTNISTQTFYDKLEEQNLLTPLEGVVAEMEKWLGASDASGETYEVGPRYKDQGGVPRKQPEYLDEASGKVCDLLNERAWPLHQPR